MGFSSFNILPFFINLVGGIGMGIIMSVILYKLLHVRILEKISSLMFAAAIIVSYLLAKQIDGNGFIAVATMGLVFGNVYLREKASMNKKMYALNSALEIFVFIIAGAVVGLPSEFTFYKLSLGLFVVYLIIRFIAAQIVLKKHDFAERLEVALFVPKGLATVTAAFALLNYFFSGVVLIVQLLLIFFVYSLVLDFVLNKAGVYKSR
jgi:NhaP-type Na+/H+ or K+/H+ antiporter